MTTKMAQVTGHRGRWAKLRDLLLYCTIGVAVVVLIVLYGNYQIEHKHAPGFPVKWLGLFIITALLLRFVTRAYRSFPDRRRFWRLIAIFGVVHFAVACLVLARIQKITLGDFALATVLEYFLLTAYLDHFLASRR